MVGVSTLSRAQDLYRELIYHWQMLFASHAAHKQAKLGFFIVRLFDNVCGQETAGSSEP